MDRGDIGKSEDTGRDGPLSEAQRQLWVIQQMVDRPEVYNMPAVMDVESDGPLDPELWEKAFLSVIDRHESLRTVFVEEDGAPMRKVLASVPFKLDLDDSPSRRDALSLAADRVHEPFDPARPPLIRAGLARYAPGRAIFHLCLHHLVGDGESIRIIMDEFTRSLRAIPVKKRVPLLAETIEKSVLCRSISLSRQCPIPSRVLNLRGCPKRSHETPPIQPPAPARPYSLAVAEELRYLASDDAAADREWWLHQLAPPLPVLNLPADFARPRVKRYAGARRTTHIPAETLAALNDIARKGRSSLFSLILALVKTLIHRRTGDRDIIVGIPSTTRTHSGHEGSVGYYVNTLAVRDGVETQWSFEELLSRVHASVAAAVAHGAYPFARLYGELGLRRDPSRSPVFDVMLAPQPGVREMVREGLVLRNVDFEIRAARFDLTFTYVEESDGSLTVFADYDSSLFLPQTIESMLAELKALAEAVRRDSRMPLGSEVLHGTIDATDEPESESASKKFQDTNIPAKSEDAVGLGHRFGRSGRNCERGENCRSGFQPRSGQVRDSGAPRHGWKPLLHDGRNDDRNDDHAHAVIPAKAGIQVSDPLLDSRLRGNDGKRLTEDLGTHSERSTLELPLNAPLERDGSLSPPLGVTPAKEELTMVELLAEAWQSVLGAPVAPADNFFALGGDSIKAIQVCGRLRKAGVKLNPRLVFEYPVLGDLARLIESTHQATPASEALPEPAAVIETAEAPSPPSIFAETAEAPLSPIQRWLFEDHPDSAPSFLMNLLLTVPDDIGPARIEAALKTVAGRHDAFRLLFEEDGGGMTKSTADTPDVYWRVRRMEDGESFEETLKALAPMIHRRIDPGRGCHLAALMLLSPGGNRLYLAAHHLVMDAVSWRIFLDELDAACRPGVASLPAPSAPFSAWAHDLMRYARSDGPREELPYWRAVCSAPSAVLPVLDESVRNVWSHCSRHSVELDPDTTRNLLTEAASRHGARPVELLLAGLGMALGRRIEGEAMTVSLEGHGREHCVSRLDVSRTVGWFTCRYPFRLALEREDREAAGGTGVAGEHHLQPHSKPPALARVVRDFRSIPHNGIGYGVLQRLAGEDLPAKSDVLFNYLGEFSTGGTAFGLAPETPPSPVGPEYESDGRLELMAVVLNGRLRIEAVFHPSILDVAWIEGLLNDLASILRGFAAPPAPSVPLPLTPTQEGMFFQFLSEPESRTYTQQMAFRLAGPADPVRLLEAWRFVAARHESLRALFVQTPSGPMRTIAAEPPHVLAFEDLSGLPEEARDREVEAFLETEKSRGLDIEKGPTFRAVVLRLRPDEHLLAWTFHHILMDGWCIAILLRETFQVLDRLDAGLAPALPPSPSPRAYIEWLKEKDREADGRFWREYLAGFGSTTGIPGGSKLPPGPYLPRERELRLDPHATRRLAETAASLGSTPSLLLQAAWSVFLARHCNVGDTVFGVVGSGREAELDGIESMVGVFIRTVPVRVRLEDSREPFSSVVRRLQKEAAARLPHETLPLPDILASSPIGPGLFNHILLFENYPVDGIEAAGPKIAEVRGSEQLPYDLGLSVVPGEELLFRFSFNERVYPSRLVEQVGRRWLTLLGSILEDPHAPAVSLPILPEEERDRLIGWARETKREWPDARPFPALFAERAELYRDRPAIVETDSEGGSIVTYGELSAMTASLTRALLRLGAGPQKPVAVCLERSSRLVAALLAVMAAGAPYVPLDPLYPAERLRLIMEDSGAGLVLAENATASALQNAKPESMRTVLLDAIDLDAKDPCGDAPLGAPLDARRSRLHHLHVGVHGKAQGRRAAPSRPHQFSPRLCRSSGHGAGRPGPRPLDHMLRYPHGGDVPAASRGRPDGHGVTRRLR
jgi:non-ribosomal peptide synthase protein (TIGR01720 family)